MHEELGRPFLRRVAIENFKSIEKCDVTLEPLTFLVGRNGAGKSNFLDALHFVADGLQTSLDHAIKARGGIDAVRRRSTGHPRNFAIRLDFHLHSGSSASYGFELAARKNGGFAVKLEQLEIRNAAGGATARYRREERAVYVTADSTPPVLDDRLYLVNAAGLPQFRPAYDALVSMGFYNLNPDAMKELQSPDAGELLHGDGSNIASVIGRLSAREPEIMTRIQDYLSTIVAGISAVERVSLGPRETLQFAQRVKGAQHPWHFYAANVSDGTLRALGALVAATQLAGESTTAVSLVGIEEPETALHPAAAASLVSALREASGDTQIIVTTHSPDLLDQIDVGREGLLVVTSTDGTTHIAPADSGSMEAIQKHLSTPGELLRMDQLQPDAGDIERQQQLSLFGAPAPAA